MSATAVILLSAQPPADDSANPLNRAELRAAKLIEQYFLTPPLDWIRLASRAMEREERSPAYVLAAYWTPFSRRPYLVGFQPRDNGRTLYWHLSHYGKHVASGQLTVSPALETYWLDHPATSQKPRS